MDTLVLLLCAVNVGGAGRLAMGDLKRLCAEAGFADVRTWIASGNVVLKSAASPEEVRSAVADRLKAHMGKPVGVIARTGAEMAAVLAANPFPDAQPSRNAVIFLDRPPPADALARAGGVADEEMRLGGQEIFVHYPGGMGRSKLRIPGLGPATTRNINTVAKLVAMASEP